MIGNKFQWNSNLNTAIFIQEKELLSAKWQPFCLCPNVLNQFPPLIFAICQNYWNNLYHLFFWFIFDVHHRSFAVLTPAQYECNLTNVTGTFGNAKIFLVKIDWMKTCIPELQWLSHVVPSFVTSCFFLSYSYLTFTHYISIIHISDMKCIWVGSRRCECHVTWFCYLLIAKPGNKTAAHLWPGSYLV